MKRFAFSLQRMLGFKRTMYEKERNTLAQLRAQRLAVEQRRDDTLHQLMQKDAGFRAKAAAEGVRTDEVSAMAFHRESADALVAQLEAEMARLELAIEQQLQVVVALDKEVKSLEKLREHQWEDYQAEAQREESERILELVSGRFVEEQRELQQQELKEAQ